MVIIISVYKDPPPHAACIQLPAPGSLHLLPDPLSHTVHFLKAFKIKVFEFILSHPPPDKRTHLFQLTVMAHNLLQRAPFPRKRSRQRRRVLSGGNSIQLPVQPAKLRSRAQEFSFLADIAFPSLIPSFQHIYSPFSRSDKQFPIFCKYRSVNFYVSTLFDPAEHLI